MFVGCGLKRQQPLVYTKDIEEAIHRYWTNVRSLAINPARPDGARLHKARRGTIWMLKLVAKFAKIEMVTKSPDPIDKHVGSRVRMRRLMLGTSQETLGNKLGITFQQVQKYEKGTNRISASRLQAICEVLQVPVSFFFEGAPQIAGRAWKDAEAPASPAYVTDFLTHSDGLALVKAFTQIDDPSLRRSIVRLVEAISHDGQS